MSHATAAAFALCVLQVAMPATADSAELADGIYRIVADGKGTRVTRSSGGMVDLGERISENFGDVAVWSLSNLVGPGSIASARGMPARTRQDVPTDPAEPEAFLNVLFAKQVSDSR